MRVDPYLYFNGRCEEAIEFYKKVVGAEVVLLTRFGDMPGASTPPGAKGKVMHASLRIGDTTVLATDGGARGETVFQGFSLALSVANDVEAQRCFAALSAGGHVQTPLMTTPFASRFGVVADRFGVVWTVVAQSAAQAA
jgi:PhnB protein